MAIGVFRGIGGVRAFFAELRGCDVMRIEDGLLRYNTIYYDGLGFARQVGMIPRQGTAADKPMTAAFNAGTDVPSRLRRGSPPVPG